MRTIGYALRQSIIKRGGIKTRIKLALHKLGIRFGLHVLPVNYYSPVPNILELQRTHTLWAKKSELPGLAIDLDEQVSMLRNICTPYMSEYTGNKIYREAVSGRFGHGYGYIEAQALHAFVRHYRPAQIVEVGSGVTTYCLLKATEMNSKETPGNCRIVSVEPYPSEELLALQGIELMPQKVQAVPMQVFTSLEANDLLFIDSSHTVKPGGDVNHLILEVLPRLRPGVVVHFHDIYLPYDYQRNVEVTFFHWAETSLLRAFLTFNSRVKIIACLSHLHYERPELLRELFPEYEPQLDVDGLTSHKFKKFDEVPGHFPSSMFLQVR